MNTYSHQGDEAPFTAPTGGVTVDVPVLIGNLLVVPKSTAAAAATFAGLISGVLEGAPKVSGVAWTEGLPLYWKASASAFSTVAGDGPLAGCAAAAADSGDTTGDVRLNAVASNIPMANVVEGSPAPTSKATAGPVTLTAAEVLSGIVVADCAGAGRTYTLPTAALMVAGVPNAKVGDLISCKIVNGSDAAEDLTVAAGTGGGFDTNQTSASRIVSQNQSKILMIRLTNVTASSEAYVAYL